MKHRTAKEEWMREEYLLTLVKAVVPLQERADDPELALELLIEAAGQLQLRLQSELDGFKADSDDS